MTDKNQFNLVFNAEIDSKLHALAFILGESRCAVVRRAILELAERHSDLLRPILIARAKAKEQLKSEE